MRLDIAPRLAPTWAAIALFAFASSTAGAQSRLPSAAALETRAGSAIGSEQPRGLKVAHDRRLLVGRCGTAPRRSSVADASFAFGSATRRYAAADEASSRDRCQARFTSSTVDRPAFFRRHGGVRGVLQAGLVGAGAGAVMGGIVEIFEPDPEFIDVWPTALAIPGLFVGLVVGLVH